MAERSSSEPAGLPTIAKVIGGLVILGGLAIAGWFLFGASADDEVSVENAAEILESEQAAEPDDASDPAVDDGEPAAMVDVTTASGADLNGEWGIRPGNADDINNGTFAGYRIDEVLRTIGDKTVTGRSPGVDGEIVISDGTLTNVDVQVDMTQLTSDSSLRDGAIATRGIEYDTFPRSSFTFDGSVPLDLDALSGGDAVTVTVPGTLDLHGVEREYDVEVSVVARGNAVAVTGSQTVVLADHDIEKPIIGPVVSIADEGVFEFQLLLEKTA